MEPCRSLHLHHNLQLHRRIIFQFLRAAFSKAARFFKKTINNPLGESGDNEAPKLMPDKLPELYRKQFKVIFCKGNRFERRKAFYKTTAQLIKTIDKIDRVGYNILEYRKNLETSIILRKLIILCNGGEFGGRKIKK